MYQKALSYFKNNELEKSKRLLHEIINKEKDSNDAKILLGIIFNLTKNEIKAIELFNQVLKAEINYDALINKGHSYLNIANYKSALDNYMLCREIDSNKNNINFLIGICSVELNRIEDAIFFYRNEIKINPENVYAYNNIGEAYINIKEYSNAIMFLKRAEKMDERNITIKFNIAKYYSEKLEIDSAFLYYEEIIKIDESNFNAKYNAGLLALNENKYLEAEKYLKSALEINKNSCELYNNLGILYSKLNNNLESIKYFDMSISIDVANDLAYFNKATVLEKINKLEEATENYKTAILISEKNLIYKYNLAHLFYKQNEFSNSIELLEKCIQLNSKFINAYNLLGMIYMNNNYNKSKKYFLECIKLDCNAHESYNNLGLLYLQNKEFNDAELQFKTCISLKANLPKYLFNIAICYREMNYFPLYKEYINKAINLDFEFKTALWVKVFLSIYPIYDNIKEEEESLLNFKKEITNLKTQDLTTYEYGLVGKYQPFYLGYFEENNIEILRIYGDVCHQIGKEFIVKNKFIPIFEKEILNIKYKRNKIKIGVISGHIRVHSVWNAITKGLIFNLNPELFDIHVINTSDAYDESILISAKISSFTSVNDKNLYFIVSQVIKSNFDVIVYPEIGMDPMTKNLANLRLSQMQCVFWGHPQSTGLKTIDYFITADLFETINYQSNYTEEVISMPNLGVYKYKEIFENTQINLNDLGIDSNVPIYICPGTAQKYRPNYDYIYLEIIKKVGNCQFIFFNEDNGRMKILFKRLSKLFLLNNVNIDNHIKIIEWLDRDDFISLLHHADVYLDTIGFSGFNTALLAVEANLPIVTLKGKLLKSSLASGILERIDTKELICTNIKDYINLSIKIINDIEFKNKIKKKLEKNKDIIYNDMSAVKRFEDFIINKYQTVN
jgi:predicted O-linked N-acetylglucosamine transferase (SPINDLY family)